MISDEEISLSVIIVSYHVRDRLRNCLQSLFNSDLSGISLDVVVVDNASADGTVSMIKNEFPKVHAVGNDRNLGFGMACNQGARLAQSEYLLFLNPDTVVFPDTLKSVLEFIRNHPKAGIVGCRILDGDGRLQLACRRSIPTPTIALWRFLGLSFLFPKSRIFGRYNLTYLNPVDSVQVEAVSGSFMVMPTKVFRTVGGFDERFFLYGEDLDLCLSVSKSGYEVWYTGNTSIVHHKGQSAAIRPWGARMDFYRAMVIFAQKNYGVGILFGSILNSVAAALAVIEMLVHSLRNYRRIVLDQVVINSVFLMFSIAYVWNVLGVFYINATTWYWNLVLSAWFLGCLATVGEYRQGVVLPRRRHVVLALCFALGGFLSTGLIFKTQVFSRFSFVLGGFCAALAVTYVRLFFFKPSPRSRRILLAGSLPMIPELSRQCQSVADFRIVGRIAVSSERELCTQDLPVAWFPSIQPAVEAMEIDLIVVSSADPEISSILPQFSSVIRGGCKILLALPCTGSAPPVLVDITLDKSFIPESSK